MFFLSSSIPSPVLRVGILLAIVFWQASRVHAAGALCTSTTELEFPTTFATLTIVNAGDEALSITNLNIREDTGKFAINPESISNTSRIILPLSMAPGSKLDLQLAFFPGASFFPLFNVLDIQTDSATVGKISVVLKGMKRPSNMKVEFINPDAYDEERQVTRPGFYHDFMVFNKIRDGLFVDGFTFSISDTATLKIYNRDLTTPIQLLNVSLSNKMWEIKNAGDATIPPGGFTTLLLQFVSREGAKGPREATLTIKTDDPAAPETSITLSCGYMEYREDTNELALGTILSTFGYSINVYHPLSSGFMTLPWLRTSKMVGEEVRAMAWERADVSKPLWGRSLAAFLLVIYKAPEPETMIIQGPDGGVIAIDPKYGQSFLPRALGKNTPAEGYFNTTGPFALILSHKFQTSGEIWSSNNTKDLNLHFFPLRDRRSRVTPDTYIVAHDFILPRGCCSGPGCANCDYQDNIYVVANMRPADANAKLPPAYDLGDPNLVLTFDKVVPNTLLDSAGMGIGFVATQRNDDDVTPGSSSFNGALIQLDPANKKLAITSALGSNRGAINRQVNALGVWYNAEVDPYYILARIEGPLPHSRVGEESCVWFGADKDNYAKLCVTYDESFAHAFSFMTETDGVPSPPTLLKLDGVDSIRALDLFLLVTPHARTIVPAYAVNGNARTSIGEGVSVRERVSGLFFGPRIYAGILVAHTGSGAGFKTTFLRFSVSPDLNSSELKRFRTHALGVKGQNAEVCGALDKPPALPPTGVAPSETLIPVDQRAPAAVKTPSSQSPSGSSAAASISVTFGLILACIFSAAVYF